jgi:glycosyltransferase involved in cell wall biosynthesis
MLEEKLEILIITYNRAKYLERTLAQLLESPFSQCKITVLDNCSTDGTPIICEKHQPLFHNLRIVRHKRNIGACANYLRAVELSESLYTWILCDDDTFDFGDCADVIEAIESEKFDLISLGSAGGFDWKRGEITTGTDLAKNDSHYFSISSFIPILIFRTELFDSECMAKGYHNAVNVFPHFEFVKKSVEDNFSIYIAKGQIVRKGGDNKVFSALHWFTAWVNNCNTIEDLELRRAVIYEFVNSGFGIGFLRTLAVWIALEKMQHPDRVYREIVHLAFGFSRDQRLLLLLVSPFALIPSAVYKLIRRIKLGIQGRITTRDDGSFDFFRI